MLNFVGMGAEVGARLLVLKGAAASGKGAVPATGFGCLGRLWFGGRAGTWNSETRGQKSAKGLASCLGECFPS